MVKNKKKDNVLIKKINLRNLLKKEEITRINSDAIEYIEEIIKKELIKLFKELKHELTINTKETLKKEDIEKIIKQKEIF